MAPFPSTLFIYFIAFTAFTVAARMIVLVSAQQVAPLELGHFLLLALFFSRGLVYLLNVIHFLPQSYLVS